MHRAEPLVQEISACPDSWEIAQVFASWPHLLFLDSANPCSRIGLTEPHRQAERGRYSYVSADPIQWRSLKFTDSDPFATLDQLTRSFSTTTLPDLPPFQGGCAGLFGYGLSRAIERMPAPRIDEFATPDLAVGLFDWVISFDHHQNRAWLISTGFPRTEESARLECARTRIIQVLRQLGKPIISTAVGNSSALAFDQLAPRFPLGDHRNVTTNFEASQFKKVIERAREYTHAGDCFQVNIAQRLLAPMIVPPLELYGNLRRCNPAPFAGYLDLGEFAVASASPERFLRVTAGHVETRPIKGTRPRGKSPAEDLQRIAELENSTKDRAENIMIVDLLRNDLGRVCEYGSVRVPEVCKIESYPFVHHLVSTVVGKLQSNKSPADLLRATFPGGSVTGAPKVRAMEIIAELEPTARGPYCGCLGFIGFDGTMDTNILIRTFTVGKGWVQFPVGGGIVADSDPQQEYEETLHKAEGLLQALGC
jgi:para-aminobenzoate synthetase component 1